MPLMTADRVKEVRNQIKALFPEPNYKFSITILHHSTINIVILQAPIKLTEKGHEPVNEFYIKKHFQGESAQFLLKIKEIANAGNHTESEDSDYGSIPSFYLRINIGEYDKPFKYVEPQSAPVVSSVTPNLPGPIPSPSTTPLQFNKVELIDYSEKSFIVYGNTFPIKDKLKALHGIYNGFLQHPITKERTKGWVYSMSEKANVISYLQTL